MSREETARVFISNTITNDYPKKFVEEYARLSESVRRTDGVLVSALLGEMCTFGYCKEISKGKYIVLPFLIPEDSPLIGDGRLVVLLLKIFWVIT